MQYVQKTYLGKTAGGWLKNATIKKFGGVWHPTIDGNIVEINDYGNMIMIDYDGVFSKLTLSNRAHKKLTKILETCELKMLRGE